MERHGGGFPQEGSLEALASGQALDTLAEAAAHAHPNRRSAFFGRGVPACAGRMSVAAARAGDAPARAVMALLGQRLGVGVANAINTFDPEVVVIGGGVAAAGELLLARHERVPGALSFRASASRPRSAVARYGAEAGVRGAAQLAGHELAAAA